MSNNKYNINDSDIAIIGMAGRFPGAASINGFWDNLKNGIDSITRLETAPQTGSKNFLNAFGALNSIEYFDAAVFDFSEKEAELLDPQQRLLIETVYEALENSGYMPGKNTRIGLFAGADEHYYVWNNFFNTPFYTQEDYYHNRLYLGGSLTSRVSYKLNLTGPSLTVRAACATSLVTTHMACQSLLNYECEIALAGGVNIYPFQDGYYAIEGTVSNDGYTRAFDARGQGFVPGNGTGIVVLKRLEDALRDHDFIYAVIRGSSINNDGNQKIGYSAPSVAGEALAVKEAQVFAGVQPDEVSYIETHGTATPLGDAVEIKALKQVFKTVNAKQPFCAIGSVKTNIGHLNMAAGVAGLIKTTLMLYNKQIPPSLHFEAPNPELGLEDSPFYVNTKLRDWNTDGKSRIAGVSSFGIGGTNVHVVMEEAPEIIKHVNPLSANILLMSARSSSALDCLADNLSNHVDNHSELDINDISYTLQTGRKFFEHRRFEVCKSQNDVSLSIKKNAKNKNVLNSPIAPEVVFLFPSSVSFYPEIGKSLYESNNVFRSEMDKCFRIIKSQLHIDVKEILFSTGEKVTLSNINPVLIMPVIFSISYSLAMLWMSFGVKPRALIGHSLGEYVTACLSGVFTLEDSLFLIVERSKLYLTLEEGSMISLSLSKEFITPLLPSGISISAINSPKRLMLSGAKTDMDKFIKFLKEKEIAYVTLKANRAGHSCLVDKILPSFEESLKKVRFGKMNIPIISTYSGGWISDNQMGEPSYWLRQMREPVRFSEALDTILENDNLVLLETGSGQQLSMLSKSQIKKDKNQFVVSSLPDTKEKNSDEWSNFLDALGKLWLQGIEIKWEMLYNDQLPYKVPLPAYPFERKPYWKFTEQSKVDLKQLEAARTAPSDNRPQASFEQSRATYLVFDGMSDSQFELTRYLRSKMNNHMVLVESKKQKRDLEFSLQTTVDKEFSKIKAIEESIIRTCDIKLMNEYPGLLEAYDELCLSCAANYLSSMWYPKAVESYSMEDLMSQLNILPEFHSFIKLFLSILEKSQYIKLDSDNSIQVIKPICNLEKPSQVLERNCKLFPEFKAYMELLIHCCDNYNNVFSGKLPANQVLYPDGDYSMLFSVGEQTPETSKKLIYGDALVEILAHLIKTQKKKVRILEIGAGTGLLSWKIADKMKDMDIEYYFTDIGQSFIYNAKKTAEQKNYNFMKFARFDVSKSFEAQGLTPSYFDIVVGYNVIQATDSIEGSIDNLSGILVPGGLLCLIQTFRGYDIQHMIFGLSPGWWNFENDPIRGQSPVLAPEQWEQVIEKHDFEPVHILPVSEKIDSSDVLLLLSHKNHLLKTENATDEFNDEIKKERFQKLKEINPDIEVIYIDDFEPEQIDACIQAVNSTSPVMELIIPSYMDDSSYRNISTGMSDSSYRNNIDEILAEVLTDVLGVKITDINQSVTDLGFDSLSGLILSSRIRKAFNIEFTIRELHQFDNISDLSDFIAKLIDNTPDLAPSEIKPVEKGAKTLDDLLSEL